MGSDVFMNVLETEAFPSMATFFYLTYAGVVVSILKQTDIVIFLEIITLYLIRLIILSY